MLILLLVGGLGHAQRTTFGATYLGWSATERAVFIQSALSIFAQAALDGCRVPQGTACPAFDRIRCMDGADPMVLSAQFAGYLRERPSLWDMDLGLHFTTWVRGYCSR